MLIDNSGTDVTVGVSDILIRFSYFLVGILTFLHFGKVISTRHRISPLVQCNGTVPTCSYQLYTTVHSPLAKFKCFSCTLYMNTYVLPSPLQVRAVVRECCSGQLPVVAAVASPRWTLFPLSCGSDPRVLPTRHERRLFQEAGHLIWPTARYPEPIT